MDELVSLHRAGWMVTITRDRAAIWAAASRLASIAASVGVVVGMVTANLNKHILKEDLSMFRSIQQGLEHSPHSGILGRCEERIHAFQHYLTESIAGTQSCSPSSTLAVV